jgi:hypothetical protein
VIGLSAVCRDLDGLANVSREILQAYPERGETSPSVGSYVSAVGPLAEADQARRCHSSDVLVCSIRLPRDEAEREAVVDSDALMRIPAMPDELADGKRGSAEILIE